MGLYVTFTYFQGAVRHSSHASCFMIFIFQEVLPCLLLTDFLHFYMADPSPIPRCQLITTILYQGKHRERSPPPYQGVQLTSNDPGCQRHSIGERPSARPCSRFPARYPYKVTESALSTSTCSLLQNSLACPEPVNQERQNSAHAIRILTHTLTAVHQEKVKTDT